MENISILAWNDTGGVTKIHNIITNRTSLNWHVEYLGTDSNIKAFLRIKKIVKKYPVKNILVGNGREALLTWLNLFGSQKKYKITYVQHTPLKGRYTYHRILFRFLQKKIKIITISKELRESLEEGLTKKCPQIQVIYNPVLENEVQQVKFHKLSGSIQCIAIGRLTYQKNYPFMIDLIAKLNSVGIEAKLSILGEGEDREKLASQIEKLKLNSHVKMLGHRSNINDYLEQSDFFLMTSHWEGLPTSLIESLASNTRIVSFSCPTGIKEILSEQPGTKAVKELDINKFVNTIMELMQLEGVYNRDLRPFNIERNIQKYDEAFDV